MAKEKKAAFLDRDGTIIKNEEKTRDFHLARVYSYSPKAIKLLKQAGYKIIIVTNQARIALGYCTEKQIQKINKKMLRELAAKGARIDAIYYCPHHPKAPIKKYKKNCDCRKPKTGMLEKARKRFKIDFSKSFVVGDDNRDIEMGKKSGCKTILVQTGHAGKDGHCKTKPNFTAKNLLEATRIIINESPKIKKEL